MSKCFFRAAGPTKRDIKAARLITLLFLAVILSACEGINLPAPDKEVEEPVRESIFGDGGLNLFDSEKKGPSGFEGGRSIGVNVFLWRAALDTMSVWPISSADPFGGVILTDWYSPPKASNERFKMNIYILDRTLRADGLRVSVFRQIKDGNSDWQDAAVQPGTSTKLEDAILMRARQFRRSVAK